LEKWLLRGKLFANRQGAGYSRREMKPVVGKNAERAAMMPPDQMTDEQFERHALDVLHRELGVYGLARHQWLQMATVGDLAREFEDRA
jgi:hypothetical protein